MFGLQKHHEKLRAVHDDEERLIVTAWYNLVSVVRRSLIGMPHVLERQRLPDTVWLMLSNRA